MCKCMKRVTVLLLVLAMLFSTMGMAAAADPATRRRALLSQRGLRRGEMGRRNLEAIRRCRLGRSLPPISKPMTA